MVHKLVNFFLFVPFFDFNGYPKFSSSISFVWACFLDFIGHFLFIS